MKNELDDLTLPLSFNQAKAAVRQCFDTEKATGVRLTPILQGPPGQGKTALHKVLAAELDEESRAAGGPGYDFYSLRLNQCDPTDLKGVPHFNTIDEMVYCSFAAPFMYPLKGHPKSANGRNVYLLIDELRQAVPTLQHLAANIIDGVIGDHQLDMSRIFITLASNRIDDNSFVHSTPGNVTNRICHLTMYNTVDEWVEYAINVGYHPAVIGFLQANQMFFNEKPNEDSEVFCTPRSWEKVSAWMTAIGDDWYKNEAITTAMLLGIVGRSVTYKFFEFAKTLKSKYNIEEIFNGHNLPVPDSLDTLYSLVIEGAARVDNWVQKALNEHPTILKSNNREEELVGAMGFDTCKKIVNLYNWLSSDNNDPAFYVLINKSQKRVTKDYLKPAMLEHPWFDDLQSFYVKLSQAVNGE